MLGEGEFLHNLVSNEMFLDNSFNHNRISGPVPNAFRIDQHDWTFGADPETVGLSAEDTGRPIATRLIELEFN